MSKPFKVAIKDQVAELILDKPPVNAFDSKGWYAIAIDQRGHGESSWHAEGDYQISSFAQDLLAICQQLKQPPVLIGASLGGLAGITMTIISSLKSDDS